MTGLSASAAAKAAVAKAAPPWLWAEASWMRQAGRDLAKLGPSTPTLTLTLTLALALATTEKQVLQEITLHPNSDPRP